jgi:hypothetical protein
MNAKVFYYMQISEWHIFETNKRQLRLRSNVSSSTSQRAITIVVIVRSFSFELSMSNFDQFFIKLALAVVCNNPFEEVGRGYTGRAPCWEELAYGRRIAIQR